MGIQTPIRIEAFDNSNIQGVDPVSVMIAFVDGKPSKKTIVNIKLNPLKGQMITSLCKKQFEEDTQEY